ncbi:MAG: M55 family metallopeptidase [Candidatus Eremiobacteraeota bacterium]|nr:M55 family metallopeptidase [Candidatus Eremiobacteraeota bacterium]
MRLYISCDMEGTAGVCSWNQCDPENRSEYPIYRRYMTQEVRAAIFGAREAGGAEFVVNDSHWSMSNLLWDELPDGGDLRVISGAPKPLSMAQGLDSTFDGMLLTGYHAKAGDAATLSHTSSPETIYQVSINGTPCSEALLYGALAGSFGVPVLMVSGDSTIVTELTRALPWVTGVAVKDAIGHSAVDSLTPAAAQAAIRAGARRAVERIGQAQLFTFDAPFHLKIETAKVENADFMELLPGFVRTGGRVVEFQTGTYPEALRAYVVATRLGAAANAVA